MFHTAHFPSSSDPRQAAPRRAEVQGRLPSETVDALRAHAAMTWSSATTGRSAG
jgi:hypothetical protein